MSIQQNNLERPTGDALQKSLTCVVTRARLIAFHRGALDQEKAMSVRRHLVNCAECEEVDEALLAPAYDEISREWASRVIRPKPARRMAQIVMGAIGTPKQWFQLPPAPLRLAAKEKTQVEMPATFWKKLNKQDLMAEVGVENGCLQVGLLSDRYAVSNVTVKISIKDKAGRFRRIADAITNDEGIASIEGVEALPLPKDQKHYHLVISGLHEKDVPESS